MLNLDIYAIYTTNDEYRGSIKELFPSFKDALEASLNYSNWYCDKGDVWIYKYPKNNSNFIPIIEWHVRDKKIIRVYDWGKDKND